MTERELFAAYGVTVRQLQRIPAYVPDPDATIAYLLRQGWHVHRVGRVAYAHDPRQPGRAGWLAMGLPRARVAAWPV